MRSRLTYSNVVATLALFVALGGSSYAAATIGSGQIKNNSIQSKDVKNRTLQAKDFKRGQLRRGATGAKGAQGPQGAPGARGAAGLPATRLFASVGSDGNLVYGSGAITATRSSTGIYVVTFNRSLTGCVSIATPGFGVPANEHGLLPADTAGARVQGVSGDAPKLQVTIGKAGGQIEDSAFQLAVFC